MIKSVFEPFKDTGCLRLLEKQSAGAHYEEAQQHRQRRWTNPKPFSTAYTGALHTVEREIMDLLLTCV